MRGPLALAWWGVCGALCGPLGACAGYVDEEQGVVPASEIPLARQGTIAAQLGYLDGGQVEYYAFGTFTPEETTWFPAYEKFPGMPVHPMYVRATGEDDGAQLAWDEAQHPIIDTLPLQAGHSDFFELVKFTPDGDNAANDLKSRATLLLSEMTLTHTGKIVYCPVVGAQAALGATRAKPRAAFRKLQVWYRSKVAACMLMEGGAALYADGAAAPLTYATAVTDQRTEYRVPAEDLYLLRTTAFSGSDLVSDIPVPHNAIFVDGPAAKTGYTPLCKIWDVTVPNDYVVGELSSYAALFPVPGFTDPRIEERRPEAFALISLATTTP